MPYTVKELVNILRLCFPESGSSKCGRCPNSASSDFCDDPGKIMRFAADELERLSSENERIKSECVNLCDTCAFCFAGCDSVPIFGNGVGQDNVIYCPQYKHTLEKERDRWMNLAIETQRQLDCTHNRMRCLEYRVKELERGG